MLDYSGFTLFRLIPSHFINMLSFMGKSYSSNRVMLGLDTTLMMKQQVTLLQGHQTGGYMSQFNNYVNASSLTLTVLY